MTWEPAWRLLLVIGTVIAVYGLGWTAFHGALWLLDGWRAHKANKSIRAWRRDIAAADARRALLAAKQRT